MTTLLAPTVLAARAQLALDTPFAPPLDFRFCCSCGQTDWVRDAPHRYVLCTHCGRTWRLGDIVACTPVDNELEDGAYPVLVNEGRR